MTRSMIAALGAAAILGGCGGPTGGNGSEGGTAALAPAGGWDIKNACATLPTATVERVLGSKVEKAELSMVRDVPDSYSQCAYTLADRRMLVFGTGRSNDGVSLADAVASDRRQAASIVDAPAADEPGLGKAALWVAELSQMVAYTGDGRYVRTTLAGALGGQLSLAESKAKQIAIIRAAGL